MRHRLTEPIVHLDLAARHRGRRHVQDECLFLHCGRREADRIRAEDRGATERRDDERSCVRHADADQIVLEGHEAVVARDPVVIRIADRDDADRGVPRFSDREIHPLLPDDLAEALTAVNEGGRLGLSDDATLVGRLHRALLEAAHVAPETCDAMRVNPAKVGEDQYVRGHASVFGGHTELSEDLFAKSAKRLLLDDVFLGHRDASSCTTTNKRFGYKFADATAARKGHYCGTTTM